MISEHKRSIDNAALLMADSFSESRRPGTVIGSLSDNGILRQGVDVEGVISIDHQALRIEPLLNMGWARAGIHYGPYRRTNGLTFAVFMLNGHNSSQNELLGDSMKRRVLRWALGGVSSRESKASILKRLTGFPLGVHKRRLSRRLRIWHSLSKLDLAESRLDENLAIGWFSDVRTLPQGNTLVMHALGPENGELWAGVGSTMLPTAHSLQNLQLLYVIALREQGAAYYAASHQGAFGLSAYPQLRPLAIDPFQNDEMVYAGIYQSVLGQIGFRVDSRVYGARVAELPEISAWYGTAHAADSLTGLTALQDSDAEIGGRWHVVYGGFTRTHNGAVGLYQENMALLHPVSSSGLVNALIAFGDPAGSNGSVKLIWRASDATNYWAFSLGSSGCSLILCEDGKSSEVATAAPLAPDAGVAHSLQILDDGKTFSLSLDGALVFDRRFEDVRFASATGVGLWLSGGEVAVRQFEAHPRFVPIPDMLDLGQPWNPQGKRTVITEQFEGSARPLNGKSTTSGGGLWTRTFGQGTINLIGNGTAKVCASASEPNPGRTAYTVDWEDGGFADLEIEITPPGTDREQGEKARCGLIFWQDEQNYILVCTYLDDVNLGTSVSSFFHLNGFEEIYDAVWTLIPRHITWGQPYRLQVVFDGIQYLAYVNDEPVLYRALTDVYPAFQQLTIRRVGLVANWEWGDDTGSSLRNFIAKAQ